MEQITFTIDKDTAADDTSDVIQLTGDVKITFELKNAFDGSAKVEVFGVEEWIPLLTADESAASNMHFSTPTKWRVRVDKTATVGTAIVQISGYNRQPYA